MGFLTFQNENTFNYPKSRLHQKNSKKLAVKQFLALYKKFHGLKSTEKTWGFELEVHTLKRTGENKDQLELDVETEYLKEMKGVSFIITHEYGAWVVEIIPKDPYYCFTSSGQVLDQMKFMLNRLYQLAKPDTEFLSLPCVPKMGSKHFLKELHVDDLGMSKLIEKNVFSNSPYMDDRIINPHPRYGTFTRNVRMRRGENPQITAPIYKDTKTDMEAVTEDEPLAGHIHLDCFAFGMGLGCLQCTFLAKDITEARWAYDQFHMLTPIFVSIFSVFCIFFQFFLFFHSWLSLLRPLSIKASSSTPTPDGSSSASQSTVETPTREEKEESRSPDTPRSTTSSRTTPGTSRSTTTKNTPSTRE